MQQEARAMPKPFTGWHMTAILVAFFGVVIAVNVFMARNAISTFGGTVVDNSYIASQKYNGWLAKAEAQAALGWQAKVRLAADRHSIVTLADKSGAPLSGAKIILVAKHPVGLATVDDLTFSEVAPGEYRSTASLPAGRWDGLTKVELGGREFRQIDVLR